MKRRALLLDRDGVVNVDRGYVSKREQFEFMPGLFPLLDRAQDIGYRLAILTNQSGVARGYYTIDDYEKLTDWMLMEFGQKGITLDLVLASFEHEESTVPYLKRQSFWRKPNPGMLLEAAMQMDLDLKRCIFIGDHVRDMEAGLTVGVGQNLYLTQHGADVPAGAKVIKSLDAARNILESH